MRPRVRYSLRGFLLAATLCAVALGWFVSNHLDRYRQESRLLDRLAALGGEVDRKPRSPAWLWHWFGAGVGQQASSLMLSDTKIGDEELLEIAALSGLEGLYLDRTNITSDGVETLGQLRDLVALSARRTNISRPPQLAGMKKLLHLDLSVTDVTDLDTSDLISLEYLGLGGTGITDETLAKLAPLPKLKTLDLSGTPGRPGRVSDLGVARLTKQRLPELIRISLYDTAVTDVGEAALKAEFAGIAVSRKVERQNSGISATALARMAARQSAPRTVADGAQQYSQRG
jgi:hypothetical protein